MNATMNKWAGRLFYGFVGLNLITLATDKMIQSSVETSEKKTTKEIARLDSTIKANAINYEKVLEAMNAESKAKEIVANSEINALKKTLKELSRQLASTSVADTAKVIKIVK